MAEEFDPYHRWLGIAPGKRPPDHYQLLGVSRFERDRDLIALAADQQMARVRAVQSSQSAAVIQRLLNELANARLCLLSVERREAYEAQLRAEAEAAATTRDGAAAAAQSPLLRAKAGAVVEQRSGPPTALDSSTTSLSGSSSTNTLVKDAPSLSVVTVATSDALRARRRARRWPRPAVLVALGAALGVLIGILATVVAVLVVIPRSRPGVLVIELAEADRGQLVVVVDEERRDVPAAGVLRLRLAGGQHEVKVMRPAHATFERSVDLPAGEQVKLSVLLRPLARLTLEVIGHKPPDLKVTVDGQPIAFDGGNSVIFPCEAGVHVVRAESRLGKFERSIAMLRDQNFRVPISILAGSRLAGKWRGKIEIDSAALQRRLSQTRANPLLQALAQQTAETLRAGGFDCELRADGSYALRTQLGPLSTSSHGRWSITEETATRVTVEFVSDRNETDYRQFQWDGPNRMRTDLPQELSGLGHFDCERVAAADGEFSR